MTNTASNQTLITGTAVKGPFAIGSTLTAYSLNEDGTRSSQQQTLQITDAQATYRLSLLWNGPTEVEIHGHYLDENTGLRSPEPLTLCAIVNVQAETEVNVHLATHLACHRIRDLMTQGLPMATAQAQARQEVKTLLGLALLEDIELQALSPLAIGLHEADNRNLLFLSAALLMSASPADCLADMQKDFATNGQVDTEGHSCWESVREQVRHLDGDAVQGHLEAAGFSPPDLGTLPPWTASEPIPDPVPTPEPDPTPEPEPTPLSSNADLASLTFSAGTLSPTFDPNTRSYSTRVSEPIDTLQVIPTLVHPEAQVQVNGTPVISGTPSALIPLEVGLNVITLTVTAQDGLTAQSTTIEVTRRDETAPEAWITFPPPGLTDALTINVVGAARDANSQIKSVRVNGVEATSSDGFATWRAWSVPLSETVNHLTVETQDVADNQNAMAASVRVLRKCQFGLGLGSLAFDSTNQRVFLTDAWMEAVFVIDLNSGTCVTLSNETMGTGLSFSVPVSIALDEANQRALVLDAGLDAVIAVNLSSGDRTLLSGETIGLGLNFENPRSIALDEANQRALVLDDGLDAVIAVNLSSGDRTLLSDRNR